MERLVFGTGPIARTDSRKLPRRRFAEMLSERLDREVVVVVASSYAELSGLVCRGDAQVAWLPPAVYVRCQQQGGIRLLLGAARAGGLQFAGALFVRSESKIAQVGDLAGLDVAWVDHDSCAGYLFPRLALEARGLDPNELFGRQYVLGSHGAVARAVDAGRAAVGATFVHGSFGDGAEAPQVGWSVEVDPRAMRTVLLSAPIPADVICVGPGVDAALEAEVAEALTELDQTEPGRDVLTRLFAVDRFVPARDEDYELVRRAMAAVDAGGQRGEEG